MKDTIILDMLKDVQKELQHPDKKRRVKRDIAGTDKDAVDIQTDAPAVKGYTRGKAGYARYPFGAHFDPPADAPRSNEEVGSGFHAFGRNPLATRFQGHRR